LMRASRRLVQVAISASFAPIAVRRHCVPDRSSRRGSREIPRRSIRGRAGAPLATTGACVPRPRTPHERPPRACCIRSCGTTSRPFAPTRPAPTTATGSGQPVLDRADNQRSPALDKEPVGGGMRL
jgi:hypothetical protein